MPHVNPFVGLFAALVGALAAFVVPVFLLLRADIAEVRGDVAGNAERLERVEGTVAGMLARAFPERMAQASEPEAGAGSRRPAIPIPEDRSAPRKSGPGSRAFAPRPRSG